MLTGILKWESGTRKRAVGYNKQMSRYLFRPPAVFLVLFFCVLPARGYALDGRGKNIIAAGLQAQADGMSAGQRIAFFAERFVGIPYDTNPLGLYVVRKAIVADDRVDCMYLVFRSVELALSPTPEGAGNLALLMRFKTVGRLGPDGKVLNYEDRYRYGLDMILSGKWGRNITASLGRPEPVATTRRFQEMGVDNVLVLPRGEIEGALPRLKSGDIVFFVKDPARRAAQEVIGHMGIILEAGDGKVYLIHAHGSKKTSGSPAGTSRGYEETGEVVKIPFADYVKKMPFIGIMVTRFD